MSSPGRCILCVLALAFHLVAQAAENPEPGNKEVTKLDGTKLFGIIELKDDYTLKISSDSGIQNVPLALLSPKDFRKYGFAKDRSKDGRFWSERKNALESEQDEKPDEKEQKSRKPKSMELEIHLAELAPLQPLIAAYESANPPAKKPPGPSDQSEPQAPPEKSSTMHMFSGPGSLNIPGSPFSGATETVIKPAASAASSAAEMGGGLVRPP